MTDETRQKLDEVIQEAEVDPAALTDWHLAVLRAARDRIAELERERDQANESWHYANGVAELAMKHRDEAEAECKRLRRLGRDRLTFEELRCANNRRKTAPPAYQACASWTALDWLTALTGEVGELANFLKKWRRGDIAFNDPEVGRELADILIYLDILAGELGFDLEVETVAKFNATSEKIGSDVRLEVKKPALDDDQQQGGRNEDGWSEMKHAIWQRGHNVGWNAVLEEAATITQGHGSLQEKVDRICNLKRDTKP